MPKTKAIPQKNDRSRYVRKSGRASVLVGASNSVPIEIYIWEKGVMTKPQPNNPLHGITLEMMLNQLVKLYGWDELGRRIPIRCFRNNPSIKSSLKFLRHTPWARKKVEELYLKSVDKWNMCKLGKALIKATNPCLRGGCDSLTSKTRAPFVLIAR